VKDLQSDTLVRLQDRQYTLLAVFAGLAGPAAVGLLWGEPITALMVGGVLRVVVQWHATFCINSLGHRVGTRTHCESSARDSWWIAVITFGEGFHNYHHRFPSDYRCGCRWYHYDLTKWFIALMHGVGMASGLKRCI
jgi:stearoyl-CoA desaturase (delta-9 desaturase)